VVINNFWGQMKIKAILNFFLLGVIAAGCKSKRGDEPDTKDLVVQNGSVFTATFMIPTLNGQEPGKRDFCIYETKWKKELHQKPEIISTDALIERQFNEIQIVNHFEMLKKNAANSRQAESSSAALGLLFGLGCFASGPVCVAAISAGALFGFSILNNAAANAKEPYMHRIEKEMI
jgi:hypothetical protein